MWDREPKLIRDLVLVFWNRNFFTFCFRLYQIIPCMKQSETNRKVKKWIKKTNITCPLKSFSMLMALVCSNPIALFISWLVYVSPRPPFSGSSNQLTMLTCRDLQDSLLWSLSCNHHVRHHNNHIYDHHLTSKWSIKRSSLDHIFGSLILE